MRGSWDTRKDAVRRAEGKVPSWTTRFLSAVEARMRKGTGSYCVLLVMRARRGLRPRVAVIASGHPFRPQHPYLARR